MGSNVQSHQCKMSKVAFSKADEHKKEMELFILPPWAITPVICISHHEKKMNIYWENGTNFTFIPHTYNAKLYCD